MDTDRPGEDRKELPSGCRHPWSAQSPGPWCRGLPAEAYPPVPGSLVVTAEGAGEGMTLWGKTECMKWGKACVASGGPTRRAADSVTRMAPAISLAPAEIRSALIRIFPSRAFRPKYRPAIRARNDWTTMAVMAWSAVKYWL